MTKIAHATASSRAAYLIRTQIYSDYEDRELTPCCCEDIYDRAQILIGALKNALHDEGIIPSDTLIISYIDQHEEEGIIELVNQLYQSLKHQSASYYTREAANNRKSQLHSILTPPLPNLLRLLNVDSLSGHHEF